MNGRQPMRIKQVVVRVIKPTFYHRNRIVEVGEEFPQDYADALTLEKAGKAIIVGDAPDRTYPANFFDQPPAPRRW